MKVGQVVTQLDTVIGLHLIFNHMVKNSNKDSGSGSTFASGSIHLSNLGQPEITSSTTFQFNQWGTPERIRVEEYSDRIEMIYKQFSTMSYINTTTLYSTPEQRVYKIVYSCVDGKWNKSEPIYGKIVPAVDEYYEFED